MDNKPFELSNDELESVSGGLEIQAVGRKITTCDNFSCVWCGCGKMAGKSGHHCEAQGGDDFPDISWFDYTCSNCTKEPTCSMAHRSAGVCPGP